MFRAKVFYTKRNPENVGPIGEIRPIGQFCRIGDWPPIGRLASWRQLANRIGPAIGRIGEKFSNRIGNRPDEPKIFVQL